MVSEPGAKADKVPPQKRNALIVPKFEFMAKLSERVTFAAFQTPKGQLALGIIIDQGAVSTFDKHRPPVIFFGGEALIDFGDSRSLQEVFEIGRVDTIHYTFEPRVITSVVWHGKKDEGQLGTIGKMMKCRSARIRLYLDDYSTAEIDISAGVLVSLREKLAQAFDLSTALE